MKLKSALLVMAGLLAFANANATNITVETGISAAGAQASAGAYQSVVDAAIANNPIGSTSVSLYDNISNQGLFGGSNSKIAFRSTFEFGVTNTNAGNWDFRFGVDFGNGGAVFLDGAAVAFKNTDMWWNGSYANSSQFLTFNSTLAAGNHQIKVYGLEPCCDGPQNAQYRAGNVNGFETFSAQTLAPVPEPETFAMLLAGLGLVGAITRRRKHAA